MRTLCPLVVLPVSTPRSKRSTLEYAQPLITSDRHLLHSDEDSSSGSDRGEDYSSTHFGESSNDEEALLLESDETWEMISIGGMHYTVPKASKR